MFNKKTILKEFSDGFFEHLIALMLITLITVLATGIIINYKHLHEPSKVYKKPIGFNTDISFPWEDIQGAKKTRYLKQMKKVKMVLQNHEDLEKLMAHVIMPVERMILTDIGTYYITGYTSLECGGSTMTASGATVHKGNPTTCAIDPALWDFGDLFYIPYFDQVYVAEDTGSAVKGKHLDLYFYDDEYNYALSITGYYQVYSVEYETYYVQADYFNITDIVWEVQNDNI